MLISKVYKNLIFLGILILLSVTMVWPASIEVVPNAVKMSLKKAETRTAIVEIVNHSANKLSFAVEPEYWSPDFVDLPLNQWLKVSPAQLVLEAKSQKKIKLEVTLPEIIDGEIMVMMFLAPKTKTGTLSIKTRIGFPLYVSHQGALIRRAKVTAFKGQQDSGKLRFFSFKLTFIRDF